MDLSSKTMTWVIQELQQKTKLYCQKGLVECFDQSIIKSDTAISTDLRLALKDAVTHLEEATEGKDYEPGSDNKVVNIVDPALFPVVYGRTHVLPGQLLGLKDCLDRVGEGVVLPITQENENFTRIATVNAEIAETVEGHMKTEDRFMLSTEFQWLPFDVELMPGSECRILSYINNIHPINHRDLYERLESVIAHTIPLWEQSLISFRRTKNLIREG